jgi:signal transduction histidine kinase
MRYPTFYLACKSVKVAKYIKIPATKILEITEGIMAEGILVYSADRVEYASPTFLQMLGLDQTDEFFSFSLSDIVADKSSLLNLQIRADRSGIIKDEFITFYRKDRSSIQCSISMVFHQMNNEPYYACYIIDITDRIKSELQLREKNDELKKINNQMDRFLYSASHDMRQPLTSMMGLIHLMHLENNSLTDTTKEYLDKLDQSVNKLDGFLKQVMQFTQNSHEQIVSKNIEINSILHAILQKQESHPYFKLLRFSIDDETKKPFYSDPARIEMILNHIIQNAIHYADPTKPEPFVKIVVTYETQWVNIAVIDNGIGISNRHVDKVFNMFYRGTERSKGSGLGLYIAKETMTKLEGSISIDSEVSFGTIVQLKIPNGKKASLVNRKINLVNHE